jgi:two-component system sensor histidine kinase AlgZ
MNSRRAFVIKQSMDISTSIRPAALKPQHRRVSEEFLPDMCTLQAVFFLVLLSELLALVLTLADDGLAPFDWGGLGLRSMLIQWISLLSASLLCRVRPWLAGQLAWRAGVACYLIVLSITAICTVVGLFIIHNQINTPLLLSNLLLSAIIAGIILRYLYLQQQLHNQQQAELQARIQALQSRIQPHFLFNSMNSIASLIAVDPDTAERMVEDLSALFRASLAEPGLVPLRDELELCRQYAAIEQMRLGDRLQMAWELDEQVTEQQEHFRIPSLLLQPLIENAIVHGIQPIAEGGEIHVAIQVLNGGLQLRVENPYVATDDDAAGTPYTRGNRLALDNIAHRLQAHFGPQAYISAARIEGRFVTEMFYPLPAGFDATRLKAGMG